MGFDRVARAYSMLERLAFGGALQRARTAHLDTVVGAGGDVLLLGDGDGRFLESLLTAAAERNVPIGQIVSVDASAVMLELARERVAGLPGADRVLFRCAAIEEFKPPEGFEASMISAHFFFDCFGDERLAEVVRRLGQGRQRIRSTTVWQDIAGHV